MNIMTGSNMQTALLLIALCSGYLVLSVANKEKQNIRSTGYAIGIGVIVLSILLIISSMLINMRILGEMNMMGPRSRTPMHQMMMNKSRGPMMAPTKEQPAPKKTQESCPKAATSGQ